MLDLANKHAIITGAGSGIGKATAILFARQNAHVHVVDINPEQAEETVTFIKNNKGLATAHFCNVSAQSSVKNIFDTIEGIDVLVNSAGVSHIGNAINTLEEDFERVYNVNVKGVYNCLHFALPVMKKSKSGVILNLASIANNVGLADRFAYSMSKGAVYAMTMSVAKDFINDGIRCNCISPARVHTPFVDGFLAKNYPGREAEMFEKLSKSQPLGRMATPEEIAFLILYLCCEESSFITGCDYPIDGGFIKLNS